MMRRFVHLLARELLVVSIHSFHLNPSIKEMVLDDPVLNDSFSDPNPNNW